MDCAAVLDGNIFRDVFQVGYHSCVFVVVSQVVGFDRVFVLVTNVQNTFVHVNPRGVGNVSECNFVELVGRIGVQDSHDVAVVGSVWVPDPCEHALSRILFQVDGLLVAVERDCLQNCLGRAVLDIDVFLVGACDPQVSLAVECNSTGFFEFGDLFIGLHTL